MNATSVRHSNVLQPMAPHVSGLIAAQVGNLTQVVHANIAHLTPSSNQMAHADKTITTHQRYLQPNQKYPQSGGPQFSECACLVFKITSEWRGEKNKTVAVQTKTATNEWYTFECGRYTTPQGTLIRQFKRKHTPRTLPVPQDTVSARSNL